MSSLSSSSTNNNNNNNYVIPKDPQKAFAQGMETGFREGWLTAKDKFWSEGFDAGTIDGFRQGMAEARAAHALYAGDGCLHTSLSLSIIIIFFYLLPLTV